MKSNASRRQVPAASDGALLSVSLVDQPTHAALPYVAVRGTFSLRTRLAFYFLFDRFFPFASSLINRLRSQ